MLNKNNGSNHLYKNSSNIFTFFNKILTLNLLKNLQILKKEIFLKMVTQKFFSNLKQKVKFYLN